MLSSMRKEGGPPGLLRFPRVSEGAPIVWRAKWGGVGAAEGREKERSSGRREGGCLVAGCHRGRHWMRRRGVGQQGSVWGSVQGVQDGRVGGASMHARQVWGLERCQLQEWGHLWLLVIGGVVW